MSFRSWWLACRLFWLSFRSCWLSCRSCRTSCQSSSLSCRTRWSCHLASLSSCLADLAGCLTILSALWWWQPWSTTIIYSFDILLGLDFSTQLEFYRTLKIKSGLTVFLRKICSCVKSSCYGPLSCAHCCLVVSLFGNLALMRDHPSKKSSYVASQTGRYGHLVHGIH